MSRPVVVEFLGLPGVGKSYISSELAEWLRRQGIPVQTTTLHINHEVSRPSRIARKVFFLIVQGLRRPGESIRGIVAVLRSRQMKRRHVPMLCFNWMAIAGLVNRARSRPAVHLLDQGLVQLNWSVRVLAKAASTADLRPLRAQEPPDVVIVVNAPIEVIEERLRARTAQSRIDRLPAEEATHLLTHGQQIVDQIVEKMLPVGESKPLVLSITNDGRSPSTDELEVAAHSVAAIFLS